MPDRRRSRILSAPALVAGGLALAAALAALAWHDVLPGAWTLRGWVQGPEARADWLRLRDAAPVRARHRAENPRVEPGRVVFLGASTVQRWDLERDFPGAPTLNRGVNGDTSLEVGERLDECLPAGRPAGFVVACGGNDLWRTGRTPEQAAAGVGALVAALGERVPGASVAILGLHPRRDTDAHQRAELEATNALLAAVAEQAGARFVPTDRPPLRGDGGRLPPELASDPHHLNAAGYGQLATWLVTEGGALAALLER